MAFSECAYLHLQPWAACTTNDQLCISLYYKATIANGCHCTLQTSSMGLVSAAAHTYTALQDSVELMGLQVNIVSCEG